MVRSLLGAKMSFFDSNPVGRILNRFSKDVGIADVVLAPLTDFFIQNYSRVLSILILMSIAVPFLIPAVLVLFVVLIIIRMKAVPVTNKMIKLELLSRTPLATLLGSTVSGLSTIQAYNQTPYFYKKFERNVSLNGAAHFALFTLSRTLSVILDMTALFLSVVSIFVIFAIRSSSNVLLLALVIQLLSDTLSKFQFGTKISSDL